MNQVKWLLILSLSCPLASAEDDKPLSGLDLLNHCRVYTQISPMPWGHKVLESNTSVATCLSFMMNILEKPANKTYCLPEDITKEQLTNIFVVYINKYPQLIEQDADSAVSALLGNVFPCS